MPIDPQIPADVPFTLVCERCDAGMEIASYDQALAEGWTEIEFAPDCPQANFVGLCPACQRTAQIGT